MKTYHYNNGTRAAKITAKTRLDAAHKIAQNCVDEWAEKLSRSIKERCRDGKVVLPGPGVVFSCYAQADFDDDSKLFHATRGARRHSKFTVKFRVEDNPNQVTA